MVKCRNVLDQTENVTSTNCGFAAKNHCVTTYEHTKKGLSYFCHRQTIDSDESHTLALQILTLYI